MHNVIDFERAKIERELDTGLEAIKNGLAGEELSPDQIETMQTIDLTNPHGVLPNYRLMQAQVVNMQAYALMEWSQRLLDYAESLVPVYIDFTEGDDEP